MENGKWLPHFLQTLTKKLIVRDQTRPDITKTDTVWALDNTAYRTEEGHWQAEFVVVVFGEKNITSKLLEWAGDLGLKIDDTNRKIFTERLGLLLQPVISGRMVKIHFGQSRWISLRSKPTGSLGISSDIHDIPPFHFNRKVSSTVNGPSEIKGVLEMSTFFADPEGWGIISDIDDTIKVTHTATLGGCIQQTLAAEPAPIEGMPGLYKYIQELVTESAAFFYLSGSPYTLYLFIREFCKKYFPHGTIMLRQLSAVNPGNLLYECVIGTRQYKIDRMEKIHCWLPKRKMICIGDSTQQDPEVYAQLYRKYPEWIKLILIRRVAGVTVFGIGGGRPNNDPVRFKRAFDGIEQDCWCVFDTPEQCREIIRRVVENEDPIIFGRSQVKSRNLHQKLRTALVWATFVVRLKR